MDHPLCSAPVEMFDCCLVVEDDSIIRLDLEQTLHAFGFRNVHGASTIAAAERIAGTMPIRFAILDFEVGNSNTVAVAERLTAKGIPAMFLTAHGPGVELPQALAHLPVLSKPFTSALLAEALLRVLEGLKRTSAA